MPKPAPPALPRLACLLVGFLAFLLSEPGKADAQTETSQPADRSAEGQKPKTTRLVYTFRGIETADIAWLKQMAEQGHVAAQASLARNYRQGKGVERDLGQQLIWLTRAAEQKFDWAAYELGRIYETGEGVAAQPDTSRRWYRQAAQQGLVPAIKRLADLKDGNDEGKGWQGLLEARLSQDARYIDLGRSIQSGKLSDADAFGELEKLAQAGHRLARQDVAARLISGRGTQSNPQEGLRQLEELAAGDFPGAAMILGDQLLSGKFVGRNVERAIAYLKKAASANQLKAMTILASQYENGNGVPQDSLMAQTYYRLAAEQGETHAQFRLGLFFEQGIGLPKDREQALHWYRLSAQGNLQQAKDALARLSAVPGASPQAGGQASGQTGGQPLLTINTNTIPDPRTQAILVNVDRTCKDLSVEERGLLESLLRTDSASRQQDAGQLLADTKEQAAKIACGPQSKGLLRMGVTANLRPRYQEFKNKDAEAKFWSILMPARLLNRRCGFYGEEKAKELDRLTIQLDKRIQERVRDNQALSMAVSTVEEEQANFANKSACDAKARQLVDNAVKMADNASKKRGQEF